MTTVALLGDVMTGRGMDQALPSPGKAHLHEPWVKDASVYLQLAEEANGPVGAPLDPAEPWGDLLPLLRGLKPEARIANLETAVTARGTPWRGKGVHYRMHPANAECLRAAGLDVCSVANNHVLDWGYRGLDDTLETLKNAGIIPVGAGEDRARAQAPASLSLPGSGCLRVFALAVADSGVPRKWQADEYTSGITLLPNLSDETMDAVVEHIRGEADAGDTVIVTIHWGPNWGYGIPPGHRRFARRLIDEAGVDLIHGHSSHHPKGMEVYRDRLILYGCGDCVNDYEGIGGHESFRPELGVVPLPELDEAGRLRVLRLAPMRRRRLRLEHAGETDRLWLCERLERASASLGSHVREGQDELLHLETD